MQTTRDLRTLSLDVVAGFAERVLEPLASDPSAHGLTAGDLAELSADLGAWSARFAEAAGMSGGELETWAAAWTARIREMAAERQAADGD